MFVEKIKANDEISIELIKAEKKVRKLIAVGIS